LGRSRLFQRLTSTSRDRNDMASRSRCVAGQLYLTIAIISGEEADDA
jgi:hypothetical protein